MFFCGQHTVVAPCRPVSSPSALGASSGAHELVGAACDDSPHAQATLFLFVAAARIGGANGPPRVTRGLVSIGRAAAPRMCTVPSSVPRVTFRRRPRVRHFASSVSFISIGSTLTASVYSVLGLRAFVSGLTRPHEDVP